LGYLAGLSHVQKLTNKKHIACIISTDLNRWFTHSQWYPSFKCCEFQFRSHSHFFFRNWTFSRKLQKWSCHRHPRSRTLNVRC